MYERHHEPLISREVSLRRVARNGGLAAAVILVAPVVHRFLHAFHLQADRKRGEG